jgi:dihydroceramidase
MFLAGFVIWNVDNIFCRHLTVTKNAVLLPWSVLLEGHGWWHVLTGLGQLPSPLRIISLTQPMTLTRNIGGMWNFPGSESTDMITN